MSSGRPKRAAAAAAAEQKAEKKAKAGLAVGDMLPDFEVTTDEDKTITSKELVADSGAVIFFYPRANTGGCTTQACGFRDNYERLAASGYKVYGMSADKPKAQANWKAKHGFQYPLLCDPSFKALKALGVNKGDKGVRRSHLVIAKGGVVEQVHYDVSPKESIAEAAKLIKEGAAEGAAAAEPAKEAAAPVAEPPAGPAKEAAAPVAAEAAAAAGGGEEEAQGGAEKAAENGAAKEENGAAAAAAVEVESAKKQAEAPEAAPAAAAEAAEAPGAAAAE